MPRGDAATAVVVGAGAFGVATADALARRGWAVTLVEQYAPVNARGSSGDRTRLLRLGHGEGTEATDLWYIRSAAAGMARWRELAEEEGAGLMERTGLVWFAREPDGLEQRVAERLALAGAACERLRPADVRSLYPDVAVGDLSFGLYEPEAYVIRAGLAVETLLGRARRHGVELVLGRARPDGDGRVALADRTLSADCVVWACGAWLGALLPDDAPVRPAWQDVLYWHAPPEWRGGPAWIDESDGLYGFPDVDGLGIKAVSHHPGRPFDLDRDERIPDAGAVARLGSCVGRRFPALAGTGLLWGRVMPYEMTPDQHFVVGPVAGAEGVWLVGGGSGHGFKHAPALGEHVADLVEGRAEPVAFLAPGPRA